MAFPQTSSSCDGHASICAAFFRHCEADSRRRLLTFLPSEESLPRGDLRQRAEAVAAYLQSDSRIITGARVVLAFHCGPDFIAALLGCQLARTVPVPTSLPDFRAQRERIEAILDDCSPTLILTSNEALESLSDTFGRRMPVISVTGFAQAGDIVSWDDLPSDSLALLQYTSGSTGSPRGVMLTHRNLMANLAMHRETTRCDEDSVIVSWLPHFHDMGLIVMLLGTLYFGCHGVFMPPERFLRRPMRWLEAISTHRATLSGAPNFAFDWCVRMAKPEDIDRLDLSSLRYLFSGAEAISPATTRAFLATFLPAGLPPESLRNCYGLAEATVICTGGSLPGPPRYVVAEPASLTRGIYSAAADGQEIAEIGESLGDETFEIVDPVSFQRNAEGEIGEFWISGSHVSPGYWGRKKENEATFSGRIVGCETSFLRTGDLGFRHDGSLFFTGRLKETILLRGRNLFPQDLERAAGGERTMVAIGTDSEGLVLIAEASTAETDYAGIAGEIQQALSEFARVRADSVIFVKNGAITRTTSGKWERVAIRKKLESDELEPFILARIDYETPPAGRDLPVLGDSPSLPEIQEWLATWLGIDAIAPDESALLFGLDSLSLVRLASDLEAATPDDRSLTQWLASPTSRHLHELIRGDRRKDVAKKTDSLPPTQSARDRFLYRWTRIGPMVRNRPLFRYSTGNRVLRRLIDHMPKHFPDETRVLRSLADAAGIEDVDAVIRLSFFTSFWNTWREKTWSRDLGNLLVEGESIPNDTGAILALPHFSANWMFRYLPFIEDREIAIVGRLNENLLTAQRREGFSASMDETTLNAGTFHRAVEVARAGGLAIILADDSVGRGGITIPFHGRLRPIRPGIRELARRTGCPVYPMFPELHFDGSFRVSILPPLPEDGMLEAYGEVLLERWARDLGQTQWWLMQKIANLPALEHP
ncbi:MAG: AMP-binding protein [Verrucomicrobiota bacterium]